MEFFKRMDLFLKLLILTNSDMYEDRAARLRDLLQKDYDVTVFSTDFLHVKKTHRDTGREGFIHLKTKPYKKNISVGRLFSHYDFARRAFRRVAKEAPDILYVMLPANSNARFARAYQKKHPHTRVIYDLIDLWPESFPLAKFSKTPPFRAWQKLRDQALPTADYIVSECDLYLERLGNLIADVPKKTLHLAKEASGVAQNPNLSETEWDLCYLGSVNHIIDIPLIGDIVHALSASRPVTVHIIGEGERMEELIAAIEAAGGKADVLGAIYDPVKKQDVFDRCHFGLNVYRSTLCVGLTMKSTDYFECGLPLINTIGGDTAAFLQENNAGFSVTRETLETTANLIATLAPEALLSLRQGARKVYETYLTPEAFTTTVAAMNTEWKELL